MLFMHGGLTAEYVSRLNADVIFSGYETDFQQIKYMLRLVVVAFWATTILDMCKNDIVPMIGEIML